MYATVDKVVVGTHLMWLLDRSVSVAGNDVCCVYADVPSLIPVTDELESGVRGIGMMA
jgi:hypothetical protein